jgi:5-methylcytosine-specific restriction endonuclease McrA
MVKTCSKCGIAKSIDAFSKATKKKGGLHVFCKQCCSVYHASWRASNKEKLKKYEAEYYVANREKLLARSQQQRKNNRDRLLEYDAARRKNNPDRVRAYRRANAEKVRATEAAYWKAHPEALRAKGVNRRHRERGKVSTNIVKKLLTLQRMKCAVCKGALKEYHLDHHIPLALGGEHADSNMQLLCPPCNLAKSAKHPIDFMQSRGFLL